MSEKKPSYFLLEESFPGMIANIERYEKLGFSWESSKPFFKEEKGEIVSYAGLLKFPMLVEGHWFQCGALHAICTQVNHRSQGLASQLIREALQWAQGSCDFVILFTEIPKFYEKLSFRCIQEYRFHLLCKHTKGSQSLRAVISPQDDKLFLRCFQERAPLSDRVWIQDKGALAAFNTLFATYPTYWSLHYSPTIDGFISYVLKDRALHLYDIVAKNIPSLEIILDHFATTIEEIYFYFSPDRLTAKAKAEPYLYDKGHLMIHGAWPEINPFMIAPLSRC